MRASGQAEARLEALKLKKELLEATGQAPRAPRSTTTREVKVRQAVDAAQKQAVYTIVRRIVPSTVYDGKRGMPLMFPRRSRGRSPDPHHRLRRRPPGIDLLTKSGKVVGILGESRFDEAAAPEHRGRAASMCLIRRAFRTGQGRARNQTERGSGPEEKPAENTDDQDPQ